MTTIYQFFKKIKAISSREKNVKKKLPNKEVKCYKLIKIKPRDKLQKVVVDDEC